MNDLKFMEIALAQAKLAYSKDEVPVGALIVYKGNIIAQAHNTNTLNNSPLEHAEINVIKQASVYLKSSDLSQCTLYITLEPCMMCYGAIINAKIKNVYFSAFDLEYGSIISNQFYKDKKDINWQVGLLENESKFLLKEYFKNKRKEQ